MKKLLLLGYGNSLKSLHTLIKDKYEVYIYDDNVEDEKYYNLAKIKEKMPFFDIVVRSPGINSNNEIYSLIRLLTKEIISEIEFCFRLLKNKKVTYILVSGTNGKTTICLMIYEVLKRYYENVFLAGNIGLPFSRIVNEINDNSIVILELSSYQIEDTYSPVGDYVVISNIRPNHLDGVINYEYYKASKKRIALLKKKDGLLIVDKSLEDTFKEFNPLIAIKEDNVDQYQKLNIHFIYLISFLFSISKEEVNQIIENMQLPHYRNEKENTSFLATFINDSKSTSVAASNTCLSLYKDKKRIIILGGISKSESFTSLNILETDKVYIYGKDKNKIKEELKVGQCFDNLEQIINEIKKYINEDIYILFTPGCSSFDQYENYIKRGEHFSKLIRGLQNE